LTRHPNSGICFQLCSKAHQFKAWKKVILVSSKI
jgi:hypothetical protein